MSRHLLPKNKGVINVVTSGQWEDFSNDFARFQDSIELPPQARINVTSIPSPWARMLLFKEAIMSSKHMLHLEVMSNILDVIEIIYYQKLWSFNLEVREIHLSQDNHTSCFHDIIYKLFPESNDNHDIKISLLLAVNGNDTFVIAGTSQYTLFFTPLELTASQKFPRFFKTEPIMLRDRPIEFQGWLNNVFIQTLNKTELYTELVNAFAFPEGICDGSNKLPVDNRDYEPSDLFNNDNVLKDLFNRAKRYQISSPHLLELKETQVPAPLVFDTSINMPGRQYYNEYTFISNFERDALAKLDRGVLPGENIRYPWVLPYCDFLQPSIICYRYKLNDDVLIMGHESNSFNYLLPLTDKFFKYYSHEDVDKLVSIIDDGHDSVKVKLKIPLQDGKSMSIERRYNGFWSDTNHDDCIIEFDEKDISTPLPHLILWPKLHPDIWSDPFYCMIYGERYDSHDKETHSLDFMDANNNTIQATFSRKSKSVEIVKLQTLPTLIAIKDIQRKVTGYLLIDHNSIPKPDSDKNDASVGIDFGTSHTNIAIRISGNTEIIKYYSKYLGSNLNPDDFINTLVVSDSQMTTDNIPILIKRNLSQYLFPNRLGDDSSSDETCFPMPTMVVKEENISDPEALLHYSINFSKSVLYPYNENAKPISRSVSAMTDLKWNHDTNNQNASEAYLSMLLMLLRSELIKRKVNLTQTKYFWAYPRSFSKVDTDRYNRMWGRMLPSQHVKNTDESKAALLYFDHIGTVSSNNPGMVIIADVGGGSSDVSVWHNQDIRLLTSSLWAGRDLAGYKDVQGFYSILLSTLSEQFPEISNKHVRKEDPQTHLNYILYSIPDDKLVQYTLSDRFYKVRFLIIYFFSTLFYEIGLQSRRFADSSVDTVDICLAGNGSRFACWSGSIGSVSDLDSEVYKAVLRSALEVDEKTKIKILSSQNKKWEVAVGLCEGREELFNKETKYQPVISENILIQGNAITSSTSIPEFDEVQRDQLTHLYISKSESELVKFHDILFDALGKSDLYRHGLNADSALKDLDEIKTELLGDWNNLVGHIRTMSGDNITNLSSISSSLFILGAKVTIKRLHRYLTER